MAFDVVDEDLDYERFGGPIAPGNLMTLLRACLYDEYSTLIPHQAFDMEKMAREINGWLVLVGDTVAEVADREERSIEEKDAAYLAFCKKHGVKP